MMDPASRLGPSPQKGTPRTHRGCHPSFFTPYEIIKMRELEAVGVKKLTQGLNGLWANPPYLIQLIDGLNGAFHGLIFHNFFCSGGANSW